MIKQTLNSRELFVRGPRLFGLAIFCIVFTLIATISLIQPTARVQAASNNTLNFQARLQSAGGAIAPDGYYNIEFKVYNASTSTGSSQGSCTGDSACLWTETYYDTNGVTAGNDFRVRVKNGYITVNLGSRTAFPAGINWDQDLWITMNIGGTAQTATPTYDGEMNPRLKLTGVPYAFRAGELAKYNSGSGYTGVLQFQNTTGGNQTFIIPDQGAAGTYTLLTTASAAGSYILNSTSLQAGSNFHISATGIAETSFQTPLVDTYTAGGVLALGTTNATGGINLNQNTTVATGKNLTVTAGATSLTGLAAGSSTALSIFTGAANNTGVIIRGAASQSSDLLTFQNNTPTTIAKVDANGSIYSSQSIAAGTLSPPAGVNLFSTSTAPTNIALVARGASGQTNDVFQLQDATSANVLAVDASGNINALGNVGNPFGGIGTGSNLLLQSEAFDNASWTKTNVTAPTANTIADPRGQTTAESLATSTSGGSVTQNSSTATSNTVSTFSVWLKAASGTQNVDLRIDGSTSGTGTAKTVTATTTWQRFFVSQNTNGFAGNVKVSIFPGGTAGSGTIHAWGAQLSQSTAPQVYMSTTTSTLATQTGIISADKLFVGSSAIINSGLTVNNAASTFNAAVTISAASALTLGTTGTNNGSIIFRSSNTGSGNVTLQALTTQGATARTINLPDADGTVCLQSSASCGFALSATNGYVQFAPGTIQADSSTNNTIFINKTGGTGNVLQLQKTASDIFVIGNTGNITASGTYNTNTFTSSSLQFGAASTASIQSAASQALNISSGASAALSLDSGASGTVNVGTTNATIVSVGSASTNISLNGLTTVTNGSNIALKAGVGSPNDAGDIVFSDSSNVQKGRIWSNNAAGSSLLLSSGDNTADITIDNSGDVTINTNQTTNGNITQSGSGTVSTGTGNVSLNGNTTVASGKSFTANGTALFQNATNSTTAFQVQNVAGGNVIGVDTTPDALNLITNSSFEANTTGWVARGATANFQRLTTQYYTGGAALRFDSSAVDHGVNYGIQLSPSTTYTFTAFIKSGTGSGNAIKVGYAADGSTETAFLSGAQSYSSAGWTRILYGFTTPGTVASNAYFFVTSTSATARTFYIDTVGVVSGSTTTSPTFSEGKLQLNGVITTPTIVRNNFDSTNAFAVQAASGSPLINADTLNSVVNIGNSTATSAKLTISTSAVIGLQVFQGGTAESLAIYDSSGTSSKVLSIADDGLTTFKNVNDNATAFQVQNANADRIFSVDTAGSQIVLGKPSTINGKLSFQNSGNANVVNLVSGATSASYTLTLPTALNGSGACLVDTTGAGVLGFAACSNGINTIGAFNAATSYANGAQIVGTTLTFGAADASNPGLVSTGTQNFAGNKTFNGNINIGSATTTQQVQISGGAASHGIELGRTDGTASTPFFDFHSGATAVDFDARLIASAGSGSNGGGVLEAVAGTINLTGDTSITANKNLSLAAGTGTFSQSFNATTGTAQTLNLTNTTGTQTNGVLINRNGAGGTTTNAVNITNTAGTLTTGLQFTGAMTNLINATNFTVTSAGALSGSTATLSGASALTLGTVGTNNGSIAFRSSNAGSGAVTLRVSTTQGATARTITLPDEDGTICLQGSVNCGFAPSATNGYVQFAPATAQTDATANSSIFINKTGSGNLITLQNAAATVFSVSQTGGITGVGVASGTGQISGSGGVSVTGTTSINNNNNAATSINTGSSTGLVSIGGGSGTFSLDTTTIDISAAGAITGATGMTFVSGNFDQSASAAGTFKTGGGAVSLNGDTTVAAGKNLVLAAGTGTFTQNFNLTTAGTAQTLTLSNATGTNTNGFLVDRNGGTGTTTNGINITNTAGTLTNGLAFTGTIGTDINRASGTLSINGAGGINLQTNGTTTASLSATGAALFKNSTNSTTGFQVQQSGSTTPVFNVDTQNARVGIGTNTPLRPLHVYTNNTETTAPSLLIQNAGTGDASAEFKSNTGSWYLGTDASDADAFKLNSSIGSGATTFFGNTTTGNATDSGDNNFLESGQYTTPTSGSVTKLAVYIGCAVSSSPNDQFRMGIYTNSAGTPGTLLGQSNGQTLVGGWNIISLITPVSVTATNTYWITYLTNGSASNQNCFNYTTGVGGNKWATFTYGTMPASWPGTAGTNSNSPSFYAIMESGVDTFSSSVFRVSATGAALFKNYSDSPNAFQIQNSLGAQLFNINTSTGAVTIGNNTGSQAITLDSGTGDINIGIGGQARNVNLGTGAAAQIVKVGSTTAGSTLTLQSAGNISAAATGIQFTEAATARTVNVAARAAAGVGTGLTVTAGAGNGANAGGALLLQGGAAGSSGNVNGGGVTISGGAGFGTGTKGVVTLSTTNFDAAGIQTLSSAGVTAVTTGNVDNFTTLPITATASPAILSVPDPSQNIIGRVLYITARSGTLDFTLRMNAARTAIDIAMKANSTATLIWNGTDWTAAGASSSTDLQSAYNNTLTSAGGAELVLNAPGSAADGLTIRNNSTTPINGGLFEVQSSIGTNLFSVNNFATEYAANGGAETAGGSNTTFPATTWSAKGAATVSRTVTAGQYTTGQAGVSVVTTGATQGATDRITSTLTASTQYQVSFTAKSITSAATLNVNYSVDSTATSSACTTNNGSTTSWLLSTTAWSKITCLFTTPASGITSTNGLFVTASDATARTFYIDNLSVTPNTSTSTPSNVQIGSGLYGGQPTLLTLDQFSAPPVATGNSTYYGSMYYDTTTGRIQCYESDGWGACGSSPDNIITLTPEYTGAVMADAGKVGTGAVTPAGIGTLTSEFCANQTNVLLVGTLCSTGEARNYYRWTSPQSTDQTYSIYVNYKLPSTFKGFESANTVKLTTYTTSLTLASATLQLYNKDVSTGLISSCGTATTINTAATSWQQTPLGADETACGFSAGDYVIFKIDVKAKSNASIYVENLDFTFTNK